MTRQTHTRRPAAAQPSLRLRGEQGRDPYDGLRPWSALTHALGVLLSLVGTLLLLHRCQVEQLSRWHLVSFAIYGGAMFCLYLASTLYHCLNGSVGTRLLLRKLDHCSIALLIAGSYTPVCLTVLRQAGGWGWALCGVIWAMALCSCCLSIAWIGAPRWLSSGVYLVMGWLALVVLYPLSQLLPAPGMAWLVAGGVLYTVGGVLYAVKWPLRDAPRFGCHEIFHLFILAGSLCHFALMYQVVAFC